MMKRWTLPLLMVAMLPSLLFVAGCSDDDDNPADPNKGYEQVYIRLHAGDQFTYDMWDLDENNQKIESTKAKYEIKFNTGSGKIGIYNDWFSRIGVNRETNERDTLYVRTDDYTRGDGSAYTRSIMAYGFVYETLQKFIAEVMKFGNVGVPTIPAQTWDQIAKYYDENGDALQPGAEWDVGDPNGIPMNFTISGQTVSVDASMKGKLEAREEKVTANGKEITTWKTSITATFDLLGSVKLETKLIFWFSNDPATQVKYVQESASTTIPLVNLTINIPGQTQELVSWI
ncbi:hypothetical protein KQI65_10770 [bacterium]|nr:hypothetical protein [bacterium]